MIHVDAGGTEFARRRVGPRPVGRLPKTRPYRGIDRLLEGQSALAHRLLHHAEVLRGLLLESGTAGNLTTDAQLAALAIEHGAELVSYDRDFGRFQGLRHRLPSAAR